LFRVCLAFLCENILWFEEFLVNVKLHRCHISVDDDFNFVWEFSCKICFSATQEERTKNFVQALNQLKILFILIGISLLLTLAVLAEVKPLFKIVIRVENLRHHEIQESPQFKKVVLQWCTSEHQTILCLYQPCCDRNFWVFIFEFVSLINDKVLPFKLFECITANSDTLISCDTNIKLPVLHLFSDNGVPNFHLGIQLDNSKERNPLSELLHPVRHCWLGCNNKVRSSDFLVLEHVCKYRYSLDCLTQTLQPRWSLKDYLPYHQPKFHWVRGHWVRSSNLESQSNEVLVFHLSCTLVAQLISQTLSYLADYFHRRYHPQ